MKSMKPTTITAVLFAMALAAFFGLAALGSVGAGEKVVKNGAGSKTDRAVATFASGCFWCTESDFDKIPGVLETESGYTGGKHPNPTYRVVSSGRTGHTEALRLVYDPKKVSYETLINHYWRNVDLLDGAGQFCDRGSQYRPAIFTHTPEQREIAERTKREIDASKKFSKPVAVTIHDAVKFYPAESYHQNYHQTNQVKYKFYRYGCRRDQRLKELWGEPKTH